MNYVSSLSLLLSDDFARLLNILITRRISFASKAHRTKGMALLLLVDVSNGTLVILFSTQEKLSIV
jgi:hypothetical protein